MLGLTYQQIATNLCVDLSTVWRTLEKFNAEGSVVTKYNEGPQTLTEFEKFFYHGDSFGEATAYLREICTDLCIKTDTTISESAICRFLQRNNFSRKKLHTIAKQCNDELRASFTSD